MDAILSHIGHWWWEGRKRKLLFIIYCEAVVGGTFKDNSY